MSSAAEEGRVRGLLHEINNPLAVAMANMEIAQLALTELAARSLRMDAGAARDAERLAGGVFELRDTLREAHDALARIRDIVRAHKRALRADSAPPEALAIARATSGTPGVAACESGVVQKAPAARVGGRGHVLVVDDEEALARALRRALLSHHDVTIATSGAEALERVANGGRYDVILLDLTMPGLGGADVYARLALLEPKLSERVVFLTGGAYSPTARAFLARVPNRRLDKPVDALQLLALLDELVEQAVTTG